MTRRLGASLTGGLSLLVFASAFGCEAQVNDEYTGEPLLSVQGNVLVSAEQADSDLVPRLGFWARADAADDMVVTIDGELSGEFPAKFRFDVTQPPPDAALSEPEGTFNSKYAAGFLVLAPSESPHLTKARLSHFSEEDCGNEGTECTRIERECDDAGHCRERTLECTEHPCEIIEHLGDSSVGPATNQMSDDHCESESCYSVETFCDVEGNCGTDIYQCDFAQYGEFDGARDGVMTTCILQSESEDSALLDFDGPQAVAIDYMVVYVTDDNPATLFGSLKRGYNLVTWGGSKEAFLVTAKCEAAALTTGIEEYNEEHGTEFLPLDEGEALDPFREAAARECGSFRVIAQPLDEVLTLEMGGFDSVDY